VCVAQWWDRSRADFLQPSTVATRDASVAMIRVALTDKYADMAGPGKTVLADGGKLLASGHKAAGSFGGGLLGGSAKNTTAQVSGIVRGPFRHWEVE
jgi:hypothetical protein